MARDLEKTRIWNRSRQQRKRNIIKSVFGDTCFICGEKNHPYFINTHKKDGVKHKQLMRMGEIKLREHLAKHKDDYVPLCTREHRKVHTLMKCGLTWQQISEAMVKIGGA
jgi:hypothetical protein